MRRACIAELTSDVSVLLHRMIKLLYDGIGEKESFVDPAKVLASDAVDLLFGDAEEGKRIAQIRPRFTKTEYLAFLDSFARTEKFDGRAEK